MESLIFRELQELLESNNSYVERYKDELNKTEVNLWKNIDKIPNLDNTKIHKVLTLFLCLACECQNNFNIELGRASLIALPVNWLAENIRNYIEPFINDDWTYRRLIEVSWKIDRNLVADLVKIGINHSNPEIRETAGEAFEELNYIANEKQDKL